MSRPYQWLIEDVTVGRYIVIIAILAMIRAVADTIAIGLRAAF